MGPESLGIEEETKVDTWISLRGENRIDFSGGLGRGGYRNGRMRWEWEREPELREGMQAEKVGIKGHLKDGMGTQCSGNPKIYEGDLHIFL